MKTAQITHITQNWVPILNKIGSPWHLGAVHQVEAILTAVSSEASYLHTLDLSNNLLSVVEPQLLGDALMTLESATLYDTSLTVAQVCRD